MGIGAPALATNQRKEGGIVPPGPPFALNSADNGLSVDPVTGKIVLGGDPGTASLLLGNREIDMQTFSMRLLDTAGDLTINSTQLQFNEISGANFIGLFVNPVPGNAEISIFSDTTIGATGPRITMQNGISTAEMDLTGAENFTVSQGGNAMLLLSNVNALYQFGDVPGAVNGNRLTINDTTNEFAIENIALNAFVSINGTPGFSGTVSPVNSITVIGGIVTAVS